MENQMDRTADMRRDRNFYVPSNKKLSLLYDVSTYKMVRKPLIFHAYVTSYTDWLTAGPTHLRSTTGLTPDLLLSFKMDFHVSKQPVTRFD